MKILTDPIAHNGNLYRYFGKIERTEYYVFAYKDRAIITDSFREPLLEGELRVARRMMNA